jgi:hypothetical protein
MRTIHAGPIGVMSFRPPSPWFVCLDVVEGEQLRPREHLRELAAHGLRQQTSFARVNCYAAAGIPLGASWFDGRVPLARCSP